MVVMAVAAVSLPGALEDPSEKYERQGEVRLSEVTVGLDGVTGDSARFTVDAYLQQTGGTVQNVSVVYRASDLESGFVETVQRQELGDIDTDGETIATRNLTVERDGGYRLEVLLYRDGERVETGGKTIRGVGTLTPEYARTPVQFHEFDRGTLPAIEFSINEAGSNRTKLDVSAYLTNRGNTTGDLTLELIARQAESNIVADRKRVEIGQLESGQTATPSETLVVPSKYNYYLDAILWKDDVIVGSTRSVANLDPKRTVSVNKTKEDIGLSVSDFETDGQAKPERPSEPPQATETAETSTPGLTAITALLAFGVVGLYLGRWNND